MKKYIIVIISSILLIIGILFSANKYKEIQKENEIKAHQLELEKEEKKLADIKMHYSNKVVSNKETDLYKLVDDKYVKSGTIGSDISIDLSEISDLTYKTEYFKLANIDYYVYYEDVNIDSSNTIIDNDYKNYIVYNENIITENETSFYTDDKLVYKVDEGVSLPIIIKDNDKYYVEYDNRLLYVKKEEIKETIENHNTDAETAKSIATVAYHFFYDKEAGDVCDEIICLEKKKFEAQVKYLSENNYYTATMKAFELFLDGKAQLPKKTVVLTIDDGYSTKVGTDILEKYNKHATLFLITAWKKKEEYNTTALEFHSHGHDLHNAGVCKMGAQGGGIQCLDKETLLNDLKTSRELLNNTTVFCYPFYEFNDYSISVLKEAGFTMAFAGYRRKATVGTDKFRLPRYTILSSDTLSSFISYIS